MPSNNKTTVHIYSRRARGLDMQKYTLKAELGRDNDPNEGGRGWFFILIKHIHVPPFTPPPTENWDRLVAARGGTEVAVSKRPALCAFIIKKTLSEAEAIKYVKPPAPQNLQN